MTMDEIKALGLRLAELCQKYGIAELSVFGSVARGDARPDSDVDLLYVRVPGNDLGMSYFALQDDLEKLFGRPVDLVPKEACTGSSAIRSWPTRRFCMRHDELYVADLVDSTRAIRE